MIVLYNVSGRRSYTLRKHSSSHLVLQLQVVSNYLVCYTDSRNYETDHSHLVKSFIGG